MSLGLVHFAAPYRILVLTVVTPTPETIKLQGGTLSLDFANSRRLDRGRRPIVDATDALLEPDSLDRWGARLGVAGRPGRRRGARARARPAHRAARRSSPRSRASEEPDEFSLVAAALRLRAGGRRGHAGRAARTAASGSTGRATSRAACASRSPPTPSRCSPTPRGMARLHRCPGRDCGWVFLDTSGRRRWCSMATCGRREKMRRMYARKRAAALERRVARAERGEQVDRAVGGRRGCRPRAGCRRARSRRSPARR